MSVAAAATGVASVAKAYKMANHAYKNLPNKKTIYNKVGGARKVIHKAGSTPAQHMVNRVQQAMKQQRTVNPAKQAGMVMKRSRPSIESRGNGKDKMLPSSFLRQNRRL